MNKKEQIETLLRENGVICSGRLAEDIFDESHFYVFVEVSRDQENRQVPSNKKLNDIKLKLSDLGINAEFVLTDAGRQSIEDGLRASMLHSFPEYIRNSFLTIEGATARIWLVPKMLVPPDVMASIEGKSGLYLSVFDIEDFKIELTSTANLPSKIVCLNLVRILAPVSIETTIATLRDRNFTVPSEDWMSRMLDGLRRNGMITRSKTGLFTMSLGGLKALGTAKNRRSPDIARILALARSRE